MTVVIQFSQVNTYDFGIMQRGARELLSGANPWVPVEAWTEFYNPPFSVLFLWPLLFVSPESLQVMGGAFLFAVIFYQRAWVATAWFLTNSLLWVMGMGGVDMLVVGAGLLFLFVGDKRYDTKTGLLFRTVAYGFLMIKPQTGVFIVGLYLLLRLDWKGVLVSAVIYGLFFVYLYPGWVAALISKPPITTRTVDHSIWGAFGPLVAIIVAILVIISRRWKYWQLGGALAGILTPYGMPGLPIFLTLAAIPSLKAIPIVVIFSGGLAALTWLVPPPPGISDYGLFMQPFLIIYNVGMLGFALSLACLTQQDYGNDTGVIAVGEFLKTGLMRAKNRITNRFN